MMHLEKENQQFQLGAFLFMLVCLFITHEKRVDKDALKYLPILVKINIMESEANKKLRSFRKKIKLNSPDVFKQMWVGTFDYVFCDKKITGIVEIRNDQVFSVFENKSWLNETSNVSHILKHLTQHRITELPGWNSHSTIKCNIILNDAHTMRYFFIPHDILTERHAKNIIWEKKLVA